MATIGRVYRDTYYNKKTEKNEETIILDIRTITTRKQLTISVNRLKYPEGKVNQNISPGKEDHPDYHIWANFSNRGESLPSVIVGNMKNYTSEDGRTQFKRGKIFDPFVSTTANITFTLFATAPEKKINENHLYDVVAEAYNPNRNQNATGGGGYQAATPSYDGGDMWAGADAAMTTADGRNIPVYNESVTQGGEPINSDDIPF